ncbi:hypothetical protein BDK51DRAFT_41986 [Blyttiomyces helicus]|uniref:Uncharacterized protein n=1 Tax=Blyttiomyces helicus TaxID=388810 RepID=A0A4P9WQT4_9FUNG|nr:hypothetical protein BDK51DRAFT_41986 [Blyttiomyces helicus]|eukprot:RKO94188.1 hypothetical protein BDK51DRAFT_41986 [Blyttiomyces helicus]
MVGRGGRNEAPSRGCAATVEIASSPPISSLALVPDLNQDAILPLAARSRYWTGNRGDCAARPLSPLHTPAGSGDHVDDAVVQDSAAIPRQSDPSSPAGRKSLPMPPKRQDRRLKSEEGKGTPWRNGDRQDVKEFYRQQKNVFGV